VTTKPDQPRMAPASQPMAFLSDIHGNLPALEAVLAELGRRTIVDVFVAGDHLLGGAEPLEVWRRLQQIGARCGLGPSDLALARVDARKLVSNNAEDAEKARTFEHTQKALGELLLKRVSQLPRQLRIPMIDGREILMVYGSPKDSFETISHDLSEDELRVMLDDDPADIVVCGGTHVPFHRELDEIQIVNVGSVGQSPEGRVAHYTIVSPKVSGAELLQTWIEY
jgi:predicted phosphodiesterase